MVQPGQSSVRQGTAGRPAALPVSGRGGVWRAGGRTSCGRAGAAGVRAASSEWQTVWADATVGSLARIALDELGDEELQNEKRSAGPEGPALW